MHICFSVPFWVLFSKNRFRVFVLGVLAYFCMTLVYVKSRLKSSSESKKTSWGNIWPTWNSQEWGNHAKAIWQDALHVLVLAIEEAPDSYWYKIKARPGRILEPKEETKFSIYLKFKEIERKTMQHSIVFVIKFPSLTTKDSFLVGRNYNEHINMTCTVLLVTRQKHFISF